MQGKIHDGKAIEFVAPTGGVVAGQFYRNSGWNHIATVTAAQTETYEGQIDPTEVFRVNVGAGITANKGDVIYIPTAGAGVAQLTNTAAGNIPALKVTDAKDSNNVCEARLLNVA